MKKNLLTLIALTIASFANAQTVLYIDFITAVSGKYDNSVVLTLSDNDVYTLLYRGLIISRSFEAENGTTLTDYASDILDKETVYFKELTDGVTDSRRTEIIATLNVLEKGLFGKYLELSDGKRAIFKRSQDKNAYTATICVKCKEVITDLITCAKCKETIRDLIPVPID